MSQQNLRDPFDRFGPFAVTLTKIGPVQYKELDFVNQFVWVGTVIGAESWAEAESGSGEWAFTLAWIGKEVGTGAGVGVIVGGGGESRSRTRSKSRIGRSGHSYRQYKPDEGQCILQRVVYYSFLNISLFFMRSLESVVQAIFLVNKFPPNKTFIFIEHFTKALKDKYVIHGKSFTRWKKSLNLMEWCTK